MKIIQCIADIESIKAIGEIPLPIMNEIEDEFQMIYEVENIDSDLYHFHLPMRQAIVVLEKGDDVLAKLDQPLALST